MWDIIAETDKKAKKKTTPYLITNPLFKEELVEIL